MSNALAIATVTETLRSLIDGAVSGSGVVGAHVTTLRPDATAGLPSAGVNVFLYQVTPNNAWQNADLPTRRADNSLVRRPQTALDLHYLITFYGDDTTLDTQRLLGATVLQLHAAPVLSRDLVRQAQNQVSILNNSNLADQVDLVRVRPANLSLDETNKLWMTFPNVDYVLSIAYVAGVVLIESDDLPAPALPVRKWRTQAVPFSLASIDSVDPQPVDLVPGAPTRITLTGSNLDPTDTASFTTPGLSRSLVGNVESGTDGRQLVVTLPSQLRSGVNTVVLTRYSAIASTSSDPPRMTSQSNAAPFTLRPRLVSINHGATSGQLVVVVAPPVGPQQQVTLLLNQLGTPAPQAFFLPAGSRAGQTDTFQFDISDVPAGSVPPALIGGHGGSIPAGTYLVRVRVDGAESPLTFDEMSGRYQGPTVMI